MLCRSAYASGTTQAIGCTTVYQADIKVATAAQMTSKVVWRMTPVSRPASTPAYYSCACWQRVECPLLSKMCTVSCLTQISFILCVWL